MVDYVTNVYTISLQPNPRLTFWAGTVTYIELCTDEHIAGIMCLGACLFGPKINDNLVVAFNDVYEGKPFKFTHSSYLEEYLIATAPQFIPFDSDSQTWTQYLELIASLSKGPSKLPKPIDKVYTCRIKTPSTVSIFQFDTNDFLEGAMKLCKWLNYDYSEFIDLVQIGGADLEIVVT